MDHMTCEKCGGERLVLFRSNPKGEKGHWWCEDCMCDASKDIDPEVKDITDQMNEPKWNNPNKEPIPWPDPEPEMLDDPEFNAIWAVIKTWDINVPRAYNGYCGATGNHVRAILDGLRKIVST
jgi:hypothetical protein